MKFKKVPRKSRRRQASVPRSIIYAAKLLQFISPGLAARFAARLFTTPVKHGIPKRELELDAKCLQEKIRIKALKQDIVVYRYGTGEKRILLVHGWSGRGTQLVKFAEAFKHENYEVISFDAPAHGKSTGKTTIMPEFIATILQLEKEIGPFDAAVGHSLGGMSLLNSVKRGLQLQKLAIIGSGDVIQDIINEFTDQIKLKRTTGLLMRKMFESKSHESMDKYSSYRAARKIDIPVLVVHDENDLEVPVRCAYHIHENLVHGELMITKGLGHRKILGSADVVSKIVKFIKT